MAIQKHLFDLGSVVATQAAMMVLEDADVFFLKLVARHVRGDFGKIYSDEAELNRQAIKSGDRILSSYRVGQQDVWVITEADRSRTVVRLPFEG